MGKAPAFGKGKVQGKFAKGWDNGKGKGGKEKGPRDGHLKERFRITAEKFAGEVTGWKGKYGWIQPSEAIEHEKAAKHNGSLFVSGNDLGGLPGLNVGDQVAYHIFEDDEGLGAEDVEVVSSGGGGGKNGASKGKGSDKGKAKSFGKAAAQGSDWSKGSSWGKAAAAPQGGLVMCKFFIEGRCQKGDGCTFSHGAQASAKGSQSWGKAAAPYGKGAKTDSWKGDGKSFGKGKDKGDKGDKGKGKHKSPGHMLERTRITAEKFTGEVAEWKGKFGFIKPAEPIEHEKAGKHKGCLFVGKDDIEGDTKELTVGSLCEFHIYEDKTGVGAEEVVQY